MTTRNLTDLMHIPYLEEHYEKEIWLRMRWAKLHKESLQRATKLQREPTNYTKHIIRECVMSAGMPTLTRNHCVAANNRKRVSVKDIHLEKLDQVKEPEPPMFPVPGDIKEVLYNSRKDYLNIRYLVPPDKKYKYIECSNWNYGWQSDDNKIKLRRSECGKIYHLLRMKGVGPQPDPSHYFDCKDVNFCAFMS